MSEKMAVFSDDDVSSTSVMHLYPYNGLYKT